MLQTSVARCCCQLPDVPSVRRDAADAVCNWAAYTRTGPACCIACMHALAASCSFTPRRGERLVESRSCCSYGQRRLLQFTRQLRVSGSVGLQPPNKMAGGGYVATGKAKRYNGKMTGYLWMLAFIGGSGGLLLGYDNGVIGARSLQP